MRKIDPNKTSPDTAWDADALEEELKLQTGTLLKNCTPLWGDAKARLKKISNGKCWYCEARQERSDNAVDHFRPKSIYPWLAFKLSNFRYVCTFCNSIRTNPETGESGGKGDHFPLFNSPRATDSTSLGLEDVVLLDPCKGSDPGLLDFKVDGIPCAKYPNQQKRCFRATESIKYYHLDHPELVESRRQLALQIKDWVDGADAIYAEVDQGDPRVERAFSRFVESICRALAEGAEYSVFARRVVDGFRDKPWVEDLLQCA